jgi:RHS repeat-associated protein
MYQIDYQYIITTPHIPHYRYFFNGQEADNEVCGEGTLHAFEYRMHDTRIGRFWSVDPLAGKFPWNSPYAFAENSPIGYLEFEGLEKVLFGSKVENFTGMTKEQVKTTLKKYYNYHHGNISVSEIMSSANDKEFWDVTDMKNVYMRSIGTCIEKHSGTQVTTDVRQRWYQWMTVADARLDGGYDGANQGTITSKDWVVGLGFVGAITGIGSLVEAGASFGVVLGLVNSFDDVFGVFTNGSGSLSQDLTPEQAKVVTNSAKTILSAVSTASSVNNLKKPETDKAIGVLNAILSGIGTTSNAKNTVEDAKKKD